LSSSLLDYDAIVRHTTAGGNISNISNNASPSSLSSSSSSSLSAAALARSIDPLLLYACVLRRGGLAAVDAQPHGWALVA
jgi:hypothetical protein